MVSPTLPFDEVGIVMITMIESVSILYFTIIIILNLLGLYISDREFDKAEAKKNNIPVGLITNDIKGYQLEWNELIPYAFASAILTMSILEYSGTTFWASMTWAIVMGLCFRALLPEITKLVTIKIKSMFETVFGKYD